MTICHRLVRLMGGEIGVESEVGLGSTFWFTLPLSIGTGPAARPAPPREELDGLSVLVVDDHLTSRQVVSEMGAGLADAATGGRGASEALDALWEAQRRARPYAVALIDLNMPDVDGFGLACAIRAEPAFEGLRLVLLTSSAQRGEARLAGEAGIDGYLTKPVRQSQLYDMLVTMAAAGAPPAAVVTRQTLAEGRAQERARVLLAEDNAVNQKVAAAALERLGYRVDVVGDGGAAVEAVGRQTYDAVLMDCHMPGVDGYEATARIRAGEGDGAHVPIVALTASALDSDRRRCLEAGMDDHLGKPFDQAGLARVLARWTQPSGGRPSPEPPTAPSEDAVLDPKVVDSLRTLGRQAGNDLLTELHRLFDEQTPVRLEVMRAAVTTGDATAVAEAAHTLKGSAAAALGATAMAEACRQLEHRARAGNLVGAEAPIDALADQAASVGTALAAAAEEEGNLVP